MTHGFPLLERGREDGRGHCPSEPEKWRSEAKVTLIPLPEGRREGGHDLSHSPPEKWRGVVMAPPSLPKGRRSEAMISALLSLGGGKESLGSGGLFPNIVVVMGMAYL